MMKYKSRLVAILTVPAVLSMPVSGFGAGPADEPPWIGCARIDRDRQLECYEQATRRYLEGKGQMEPVPATAAEEQPGNYDWKLDRLWPVGDELHKTKALAGILLQYKRNYILLDSIRAPSDAPTSPNPLNQTPPTTPAPHPSELKLQASVKARLPVSWPWGDTVWVAYSQQSHWQAFNRGDSRPFRETNYEPEVIFLSHRFNDHVPTWGKLTPRLLNLSYVHQSNGQALPRSRGWNRFTAELGSEYRFDDADDRRFTAMIRPWWRVPDRRGNDDNPDIVDYLGHGDITLDYWRGRNQYALLLRQRAVQLSWSFPLYLPHPNSPNLYLQYFNGYGESLIDYNHKLHSFGIGISLPY